LFIEVTFQKSVRFTFAKFLGQASFDGTKFIESATYYWATFNKLVKFFKAKFYGETSFFVLNSKNGRSLMGRSFSEEHRLITQSFPDLLVLRILSFCPTCLRDV
jgi:hypothetical protein